MGEWMEQCNPLLQCSGRILAGRGTSESMLGSAWRGCGELQFLHHRVCEVLAFDPNAARIYCVKLHHCHFFWVQYRKAEDDHFSNHALQRSHDPTSISFMSEPPGLVRAANRSSKTARGYEISVSRNPSLPRDGILIHKVRKISVFGQNDNAQRLEIVLPSVLHQFGCPRRKRLDASVSLLASLGK
jgi:hypothetical protein